MMDIRTIKHKHLCAYIETGKTAGLPAYLLPKLRNMIMFLLDMEDSDDLKGMTQWHLHRLTGDRYGTWSLHATRNWRLTFRIDTETNEIYDLDLEDYH